MVYQDPQNSQDHDRSDPECSVCGDFGWVRMDVPLGHPSFGRAHPCVCQKRDNDPSRIARLQRYSNLGSLTRLTFENTIVYGRSDDPVRQDLFNKCYLEAIAFADDPNGWLVLTGPSGSGKTHLAAAVANRVVENYSMAPDFDNRWRTGGSLNQIISESKLDPDSLWNGIKRFASNREKRLKSLRNAIPG